jgi:thiamine-monophosphate kinase
MDAPVTARSLGEDRLLQKILADFPPPLPAVVCGPGDDCAVVASGCSKRPARWDLLKTDSVIEGVHFTPRETMEKVGWKALCRAISDVAAMGGTPSHALVTLHVGADTRWSRIRGLYRGLHRAAKAHGVSIVGGETCRTEGPFAVNVSLTGWVHPRRCVFRSGGRPGDVLCVSGRLGGSLRSGRHLTFKPRLREASWLVEHFKPTAMMDLSDGLAADLPRLAQASSCGARLQPEAIPRHAGCSLHDALNDGEDFELLLSVSPRRIRALVEAWRRAFPRVALTPVGVLTGADHGLEPAELFVHGGYHHFA